MVTDAENDVVSVTVSAGHGTLTAGSQTGSSITFTDTPSVVTSDLANLTYTPNANYHGTDSISANVAETSFGKLTASSTVGVTITGDQAPTVSAPSSVLTSEGTAITLTGANAIVVTDAENDVVSVTVSAGHGTLTAGSQTGSSITFTGTASNVTADLTSLSYTPTANYHGADSISVNVAETQWNHLTASSTVAVMMDSSPTINAPSAVSTAEGTAISLTGSNAITITDPENDQVSVTVSAAQGTLKAGAIPGQV